MSKQHAYTTQIEWTGNTGDGTRTYKGYERTWNISVPGKPVIACSNDPLLGGDPSMMNPEDLLLSALSACHMLWYLHLASTAGISVLTYEDAPIGTGSVSPNGAGQFLAATLKPVINVAEGCDLAEAHRLHNDVHQYCFIARSVNFPVTYEPTIRVQSH